MTNLSLKARVMMATTGLTVAFLFFIGFALIAAYKASAEQSIERQLAQDVDELIALIEDTRGTGWLPNELIDPNYNQPRSPFVGLVYDEHGKLIWRSLSSYRFDIDFTPLFANLKREFTHRHIGQNRFFSYELSVLLPLDDSIHGYTLVALYDDDEFIKETRDYTTLVVLWLTGGLLLMLLLITWSLRWSLAPLRTLARELSQMKTGDRGQLSSQYPDEIGRITRPLNGLLTRERESRERLKHTMGDLAHSLKTPLAAIQTSCQSLENVPDAPKETLNNIVEQAQRMNQTITYQLKRAVVGRQGLTQNRIKPGPVVDKLVGALSKVYQSKEVEYRLHIADDCWFDGEEGDLLEILGNLLENAFRLCILQVEVDIHLIGDKKKPSLLIQVDDDGPGVPEDKREAILQRGVRADSRNPGQGIGLAVVADIISSYHGQLTVGKAEELGGARFLISLPLGTY